jgi:hypothetical protein
MKWFAEFFFFSFTPKDWELGLGLSLPSKSKRFYLGTKLKSGFRFYIYLGPFALQIGRENVVAEYESEAARRFHEEILDR